MFPHPDAVCEVRTLQYRDSLAEASQERLANEATRNVPTPAWIDGGLVSVSRILDWIAAVASTTPWSRRLAHA